jgi:hypothetical protein
MREWVKISFVMGLMVIGLTSCDDDPSFPITPAVSDLKVVVTGNGRADLSFSFTDGDGDLGRPSTEDCPKDINIEYYEMVNGEWQIIQTVNNDQCLFPSLTPEGQDKYLEGIISVDIGFPPRSLAESSDADSIRFAARLFDRAGHVSEFTYSELILP